METAFPPSPQWHQPHSACLYCISEDAGWFLYTLNNSIHILNPFTLKYQGIMSDEHSARINSIAARSPTNRLWAERANRSDQTTNNGDNVSLSKSDGSGSLSQSKASKEDNRALLVSGGDDMKLVCWDITTRQVIAFIKKAHQKVIKAVEWTSDGRLIVSGDKGGGVVVWSPFSNQSHKKQLPDKPTISCISASPVHFDTVAIGLEGGDILINQVNLTYIVTLRRLNGHTGMIQSLSWENPTEDHDQGYTSLASGSADQTIRIWEVESESAKNILVVPEADKKGGPHHRSGWTPVTWGSRGREIFACTNRGTLVRCSLDRGTGKFIGVNKGKVHNRVVYQVMAWPFSDFAFTISMDRKIIVWDTQNGQGIAHIECIGGNVHSLDISLLDPGRLAMGLSNETIKVWNTLSNEEPFESVMVERLQSKVRTVKWHPTEEEKLCFGLESGKIGIIENILEPLKNHGTQGKKGRQNKNKVFQKQTVFQSYHEGRIVSMSWCTPKVFEAPVPELFDLSLHDSSYCIVSCGSDGKILVTDSSKPTSKSLDLEVVLQRQNSTWYQSFKAIKGAGAIGRRDFDIHPSEDLIAIGNNDGSVEVYELKYFKLVYAYQGHHKRVNRVKWNWAGIDGGSDSKNNVNQYLLASGSDDGSVAIHRLDRFSAKAIAERRQQERQVPAEDESTVSTPSSLTSDAEAVLPTRRVLAYFSYHTRGVADLTWSPHDSSGDSNSGNLQKLVSASFDGKAIVYQIQTDNDTNESSIRTDQPTPDDACDEHDSTSSGSTSTTATRGSLRYKVLACHRPHEGQILSVHWSLTDVDRIYSGGNDWRLCCWDWKVHIITEAGLEALKEEKAHSGLQGETGAGQPTLLSTHDHELSRVQRLESDQQPVQETENLEKAAEDIDQIVDKVIEDVQSNGLTLNFTPEGNGNPQGAKRGIESSAKNSSPQKRAKNSRASVFTPTQPIVKNTLASPSTTTTTTTSSITLTSKTLNLFPSSSAAFKFHSKERSSLEIIRLARNLFCRRLGHGGTLRSEEDHIAAKERWQAMRAFFEKDNDEDGTRISQILGRDVDEMNLDDNEDDMDTGVCDDQFSGKPGNDNQNIQAKGEDGSIISNKPSASGALDVNIEDSASASGDLIFYGSRESIKALAEMEAQEMVKRHSNSVQAQNDCNSIFTVGSGLGILPTYKHSNYKKPASELRSKKVAQLGQIPITYWMGDVPKMMSILNSLPDSDLGIQDWIGIALSPMGGAEAWKGMMSRSAGKFERRGEVHAAVLCHLGIGQVAEAVDVYRKQELYREALMLLRMRLWDEEDEEEVNDENNIKQGEEGIEPSCSMKDNYQGSKNEFPSASGTKSLTDLQIQILTEWGQQLERRGFFEQACKCQLTLAAVLKRNSVRSGENMKNAGAVHTATSIGLQTLARRGDQATLRTVAGLAILLQDPSQNERVLRYEAAASQKKQNQVG